MREKELLIAEMRRQARKLTEMDAAFVQAAQAVSGQQQQQLLQLSVACSLAATVLIDLIRQGREQGPLQVTTGVGLDLDGQPDLIRSAWSLDLWYSAQQKFLENMGITLPSYGKQ